MTDQHASLYDLRPQPGDRLQHVHGAAYDYAGVNCQGTHFGRDKRGHLVALTEGRQWKREAQQVPGPIVTPEQAERLAGPAMRMAGIGALHNQQAPVRVIPEHVCEKNADTNGKCTVCGEYAHCPHCLLPDPRSNPYCFCKPEEDGA